MLESGPGKPIYYYSHVSQFLTYDGNIADFSIPCCGKNFEISRLLHMGLKIQ